MASEVDICNMALAHVNAKNTIASLTEQSKPARECNRFYAIARDAVLEDFNWPFARLTITLAEVGTAPLGWAYQYAYPNQCVAVRKVLPISRSLDPIPFIEAHSDVGDAKVILTDEPAAQVQYTKKVTNSTLFSAQFVEALAAKLAYLIAKPITGKLEERDAALQLYGMLIGKARATAMNNQEEDTERLASWHEDR